MNVPFVDLKTQYLGIKNEILSEINDVLDNTAYICGKKVKKFEEDFARIHGIKFAVGVSTGTDALHVALHAVGIGQGDEVIVPVNTFIATAEGVTLCGACPVFVDNDPRTYNIDVSLIEKSITPKTKAIVPVHLYGQPAEMDAINEIAKKYNLYVVEDCSQAHLSEYRGKKVGGLGNIGTFSFYPGKNLGAYGEGGAVTTNDMDLYELMLRFRQHGSVEKYIHEITGHNYRMEEIQAGVLNVKLKYIESWTEKRRSRAALYNKTFSELSLEEVVTPYNPDHVNPVYHLYVVRVTDRSELVKYLSEKSIQTGLHYPIPLHMQKAYSFLGHKPDDFPVALKQSDEILSLPMYPEMTDEMVYYTCESISEFYRK
ncbi:MAG: DegT/DnrJ/EryC1/StrS family aminotransferase [Ignavibacteria bacterium]|nr:DegT/DnrJ/EryC1/StrS family aminotransferase [Ignavibacteria bacterium]